MTPTSSGGGPKGWRLSIVRHLEDFPRQYAALEAAMSEFGDEFELGAFKSAYNTTDDMQAYNRVQAVERATGRVQNYVAELAEAGVKLAGLKLASHGSEADRAFAALRDSGVIGASLRRRLERAQKLRTLIEHSYVRTPAGDVHRAATLVHESAGDFIAAYRPWIEDKLNPDQH